MPEENIPQVNTPEENILQENTNEKPKKKDSSFLNIFNFKGRINRLQFFILFIILAPFATFFAIKNYFIFILIMLLTIPSTIKRFHDMNWPAWAAITTLGIIILWPFSFAIFALTIGFFVNAILLLLLPILLVILYCLMLILVSGTEGENKYGPQPVFLVKKGLNISKKFFFITSGIIIFLLICAIAILSLLIKNHSKVEAAAIKKYENKDYIGATEDFNKMMASKPKNYIPYYYLGLINTEQREYQKAVDNFDKAISLDNNDKTLSKSYENRALAYQYLGEYQQSLQDCQKAIQLNPVNEKANDICAGTYHLLGNDQEALKYYFAQIQITPKDSFAYIKRGQTYYALKQYQDAIQDYDMALKIKPDNVIAYFYMAQAKYKMKNYESALDDLNKILDKNFISSLVNNKEDEKTIIKTISEPNYRFPIIDLRSKIYMGLGEYSKAIEDFNFLIEQKSPNYIQYYYSRGFAEYYLKDYEHAINDFKVVVQGSFDQSKKDSLIKAITKMENELKNKK